MKGLTAVFLLILSNFFMVFAWYGHLQFKKWDIMQGKGLWFIILISWSIALFEYIFMVPGNRIGHHSNGGPFDLFQLKMIQEVVTLVVFSFCAIYIFKTDKLQWNYFVGFGFLILAVFFVFKKW
ncbi:MAG: DMT family protein [Bacteroidia bacterium]|nr:DMT family protein [Bacteroidia bacterium]